jgi:transcriptional regulator with XRE-family HTH domain
MLPDAVHSGSPFSSELVRELTDMEFRHAYMMEQVRSYIAFQIRALREQRSWNQSDLAREAGKTQSVISRLEDPDYEKLGLQSCLEIAVAYDVPLLVQFVEWDDWLARMSNMSPSALRKRSFDANRVLEIKRRTDRSTAAAQDTQAGTGALRQLGLSSAVDASAAANANTSSEPPSYSRRGLMGNDAAGAAA